MKIRQSPRSRSYSSVKGMVVTSIVVEAKEKGAALLRGEHQTNCQCCAECIPFILTMPEAFLNVFKPFRIEAYSDFSDCSKGITLFMCRD